MESKCWLTWEQSRYKLVPFRPLRMNSLIRYGKSSAQVLIRWSLQSGFVCIPKSVKEERIVLNGDVFDFSISEEDMTVLVRYNYGQLYR